MNNINGKNLINSYVNYENKENDKQAINTTKVRELEPFPEFKELPEKESKFKNKSCVADLSSKKSEFFENHSKNKKNIDNFSTPVQKKTEKLTSFTDNKHRKIKIKLDSKIDLDYETRPSIIFNIENTKSAKSLSFSFHHVIDYKTIGMILNIVLNSKHVEGDKKIEFLNNIYENLNKNKDLVKICPERPDKSLIIFKSIADLGFISDSPSIKGVLNNILLYFHGIGFIGPAEHYRPEPLQAKNGFDRFGKGFFSSDDYSKLKNLQRKSELLKKEPDIINNSTFIKEMFEILLSLSKLGLNKYNEDQWYIEEISGRFYVLPIIIQNESELKEYLETIKIIDDLKQETENIRLEITKINVSEKNPVKTKGKFAIDFINEFIYKDETLKKEFKVFYGKHEDKLSNFMKICKDEEIKEKYDTALHEFSNDVGGKLAIELKTKNDLLASWNNKLKIIENKVAKFAQMTPETPVKKKVGLKFVPYKI